MSNLADDTERHLTPRQAEEPRVQVHVDLHAVSHDLQEIKTELALRPTPGQILRLALGYLTAVVVALLLH